MKKTKTLALSRLEHAGACKEQMDLVRREWPNGIPLSAEIIDRVIELRLDVDWAAKRLLPAQALADYGRVKAQAEADVKPVEAQAWAEFSRVRAEAWADYERVRAEALLTILSQEID